MSARRHVLFSLASILLASLSTQAQEARANGSLTPIELKLKATSDKVCAESFVPLELTVTNNTNSDVEIRELDVFRNYTIEFITDDGLRQLVGSLGVWPGTVQEEERLRNEIRPLKADDTYTTSFKLSLWDRRAFPRIGKYSLRTYYKQLAGSNVATFEILDCKSN